MPYVAASKPETVKAECNNKSTPVDTSSELSQSLAALKKRLDSIQERAKSSIKDAKQHPNIYQVYNATISAPQKYSFDDNSNKHFAELKKVALNEGKLDLKLDQDSNNNEDTVADPRGSVPAYEDSGLSSRYSSTDSEKQQAWIVNLTDGSTTTIKPPPKPTPPPLPESRVESLIEQKGGQSYYLELVEKLRQKERRDCIEAANLGARATSVDSMRAIAFPNSTMLRNRTANLCCIDCGKKLTPSNSILKLATGKSESQPTKSLQQIKRNLLMSKSVFCLNSPNSSSQQNLHLQNKRLYMSRSNSTQNLTSSKYSMFGGLKSSGGPRTVPRLSYARQIGPRYQLSSSRLNIANLGSTQTIATSNSADISNNPVRQSRYLKFK